MTCLIPLDGSSFSRQILPVVRRVLNPANYQLTLIRVAAAPQGLTPLPPRPIAINYTTAPLYESAYDAQLAHHPIYASQIADNVAALLQDELQADAYYLQAAGFTVDTIVRFGDPADEIVAYAEANAVDLVAMATHGHSGLRRLVMGGIAQQALRRLSRPVLVVRPFAEADAQERLS
jgi:nucleotide-binding universal stress UspA family protein